MATIEVLEQQIIFIKDQLSEIKIDRDMIIKDATRSRELITLMDKSLAVLELAFKELSAFASSLQKSIESQERFGRVTARYWVSFLVATAISIVSLVIAFNR